MEELTVLVEECPSSTSTSPRTYLFLCRAPDKTCGTVLYGALSTVLDIYTRAEAAVASKCVLLEPLHQSRLQVQSVLMLLLETKV